VQDPESGDWTLLVLNRTNSTLYAMALEDNGTYAEGSLVTIASGLGVSGFSLYGLEFDSAYIFPPEPEYLAGDANGVSPWPTRGSTTRRGPP
jgi:hypothetical protein